MSQFRTLCARYVRVIAADRQYSVFLAAVPLILSLLAHAVPGDAGLSVARSLAPSVGATPPSSEQQPLLVVLVLGGCLMGAAASLRELVKEREIYRRERSIGLSLPAYLGSKLLILSIIAAVQGLVFTLLAMAGRPGPDAPTLLPSATAEIVVAIVAVAIASMTVGLLISALVDNADRTMPLLVLVVMGQLILCGGLVPVAGRALLSQLSWLAPARWSFAATASTADLLALPTAHSDGLWRHSPGIWVLDVAMLGVLGVFVTALIVPLLRRVEPRHRPAALVGTGQDLQVALPR